MKIENIIVAIEIYDSVAYPLYRIPIFITNLMATLVSMKRIEEFLNIKDINENKNINYNYNYNYNTNNNTNNNNYHNYTLLNKEIINNTENEAIILENINFGISNEKKDIILLTDINLKIKKGELVGIIGETGKRRRRRRKSKRRKSKTRRKN